MSVFLACLGRKCKSLVRKLLKRNFFGGACPKSNKRCHENVVARLDFRAAASLLVAAESTPASRLDRAFGS